MKGLGDAEAARTALIRNVGVVSADLPRSADLGRILSRYGREILPDLPDLAGLAGEGSGVCGWWMSRAPGASSRRGVTTSTLLAEALAAFELLWQDAEL